MPKVIIPAIVKLVAGIGTAVTLGAATGSAALAIGAAVVAGSAYAATRLMTPNMRMPVADNSRTRQSTVRGTVEPQKLIYGQALVSGPITFVAVAGTDNNDLYHQIALAGHECESITDIHFDNEVIATSAINSGAAGGGNVTTGTFGPLNSTTICKINKHLGTATQAADADLVATFTNYTSAHQGKGIANIVTKWTLTDESQEVWDKKKPSDIKALVKGKNDIYDPRLDTSAGANPSNSSYQGWSDNPALCIANYLTDTKFGLGVATSKIDWAAVVTAANACDVSVAIPTGTTEKRFTANGVLFGTDSHRNNIDKLLSAMNGDLIYTSGKYVIHAGVYAAPTESLDEDDLTGAIAVKTSVERSQRFNKVTGTYISPSENHKTVEFPAVQLTAALNRDNGETLAKNVNLPFTNSSYMAQRLANKMVQLSDQQKVITFPANFTGLRVAVGDRVSVTVSELGYSVKVFRCVSWSFSDTEDGGVNLTLVEDDSGSYADPAESAYSTVSASGVLTQGVPGVPDPSNLTATAGLKNIELNWSNPTQTSQFTEIAVYASANSSWSSKVEIGRVRGTQFVHDASTTADAIAPGDTRYYWIRALAYGAGSGAGVESDRNPDNDTSNVVATCGANNPNYTDVVDNIGTQAAPTNLVLTETTVLGNDGSILPSVMVSWTAPTSNNYVSYYDVEYKRTAAGEIDYGQVSDAYTSTSDYGSVASATTVELNYGGVNEAITGAGTAFSSMAVQGTTATIPGLEELAEVTIRVKAVTVTGTTSGTISGTISLQGDQTAPGIPGSITATGGIQQIKLNWNNPSDSDLAFVQIFEATTNNQASSSLIVETLADQHTVTGLGNNITRYYWLRSVDRSGNTSGFSSSFNATTQKIVMDDLAQAVVDQFAAGDAFGIQPVSTLSGVTGDHTGQVKLLTTTNTLYVWTGSAWSTDLFTASNVDPGSITAASFASGVEPISAVNSLPSPSGYTGPAVVFLTTDKKLYRYDSSVPEFTTLINTSDLSGTLASSQFSNGLRPIEVLATLPGSGNFQGRTVLLTTDNKLYRYTGTSFTKAISAADLDDQLNLATQAQGLLPTANASSGLVNSNVSINSDGTLTGAGSGQATLSGLGGGAVATLDTISETYIDNNSISTAKIKSNAITANTILAGAITSAKLATGAVVADSIAANSISSSALQTGSVVADSIASGAVQADAIAANSISSTALQADSVGASEIIAGSITAAELSVTALFSDTAVIGAIQTSAITASAISAAVADFEFVESVNIATDAITAGKIATNAVDADAINVTSLAAISANLGAVTAGTINAAQVTISNINGSNISSGQVPTARLDVAGIITAGSIALTSNIPTAVSELSNDENFVDSSGAASAAPVQSVAGATGAVSASTIITAGGIAVTSDLPTKVSDLSNDSAFVNASGAASAAPVQSVAGATGAVSASTIITAGNIVVANDNISRLSNNSGFIDATQVNSNVTAISGGVITTGTINASRINIDGVTLDTDGSNQLIIKAAGVDSPQIKQNALGTIKGASSTDQTATQFFPAYSLFLTSTPYQTNGFFTLDLLCDVTFTSPLTTSETVDYLLTLEGNPSGTFGSSSVAMITTHVQRTNSLGDSYDITGTRSGDYNVYRFSVSTGSAAGALLRLPEIRTLRGGSTVYVKLYGYQQNVTNTPQWDANFISAEALAR